MVAFMPGCSRKVTTFVNIYSTCSWTSVPGHRPRACIHSNARPRPWSGHAMYALCRLCTYVVVAICTTYVCMRYAVIGVDIAPIGSIMGVVDDGVGGVVMSISIID